MLKKIQHSIKKILELNYIILTLNVYNSIYVQNT
jgi:hypothetical protein